MVKFYQLVSLAIHAAAHEKNTSACFYCIFSRPEDFTTPAQFDTLKL